MIDLLAGIGLGAVWCLVGIAPICWCQARIDRRKTNATYEKHRVFN